MATSLYPASPTANLEAKRKGEPGAVWIYQEAAGCLMWLVVMTRLDITNTVRAVARHSINPTERHWKAVLQIIRYLLGAKDLGITFERRSGLDLSLLTDSDYAEKANDKRSVSGIAVVLGNAAVSYSSNTQKDRRSIDCRIRVRSGR